MSPPVIAIEEREYPYAFVELAFPRGGRLDPEGLEGLTTVTAEMLLRGAGPLGYEAFQEALEDLGASLDVTATREAVIVSGECLTASCDQFFALVRDALLRPRLEAKELDRVVRQFVAELEEVKDNDEELAQEAFVQLLLAPDPGSRPLRGTPTSLKRIRIRDIKQCAERLLVSEGTVLGSAGDLDSETLDAALGRGLGLPDRPLPPTAPWLARPAEGIEVWLVDKPDRTQTQIFAGHAAPAITHPDIHALTVANTIFGGTFTARLSHEIREKRGWSYGAYSTFAAGRDLPGAPDTGSFWFRYYPATKDAIPALSLGLEMLRAFAAEGPTEAEVEFAKRYLLNQLPFRTETPMKRLAEAIQCRLLGLPPDALERHLAAVAALERPAVAAAAARWLRPDDLRVVMVCTAAEVVDAVRAIPGVRSVHVVPHTADRFA